MSVWLVYDLDAGFLIWTFHFDTRGPTVEVVLVCQLLVIEVLVRLERFEGIVLLHGVPCSSELVHLLLLVRACLVVTRVDQAIARGQVLDVLPRQYLGELE